MNKLLGTINIQGEDLKVYMNEENFKNKLNSYFDFSNINKYLEHSFLLQGWVYGSLKDVLLVEVKPGMLDFISTRESLADTDRNWEFKKNIQDKLEPLFYNYIFSLIKNDNFSEQEKNNYSVLWKVTYDDNFKRTSMNEDVYLDKTSFLDDIFDFENDIDYIYKVKRNPYKQKTMTTNILTGFNSKDKQVLALPMIGDAKIYVVYNYKTIKQSKELVKSKNLDSGVVVLVKGNIKCLENYFDNIEYIDASKFQIEKNKNEKVYAQKIHFNYDVPSCIYDEIKIKDLEEVEKGSTIILSDKNWSNEFANVLDEVDNNSYFIKTNKLATYFKELKENGYKVKVVTQKEIKSIPNNEIFQSDNLQKYLPYAIMDIDLEDKKKFVSCISLLDTILVFDYQVNRKLDKNIEVSNLEYLVHKLSQLFFNDYDPEKAIQGTTLLKGRNDYWSSTVGFSNNPNCYKVLNSIETNKFFKEENNKSRFEELKRFIEIYSSFLRIFISEEIENKDKCLEDLFYIFKGE